MSSDTPAFAAKDRHFDTVPCTSERMLNARPRFIDAVFASHHDFGHRIHDVSSQSHGVSGA
jgi:hypothetical protein